MRGSDLLVQSLVQAGVKHVFGMSGHTTLPILDSISREESIRFILARHENTLVSMADGYARASLDPGVCVTHVGPSAANLLTGIGSAFRDSSPVIAITCNEEQSRLDRDVMNSWDQLTPFRSVTKWSVQARAAKDIPRIMRSAFIRSRLGRRQPVQVDIPLDVAAEEIKEAPAAKKPAYASYSSRVRPDPELVADVADRLLRSNRPLVLAGAGVNRSDATAELVQFAELASLPVAVTSGGRGAFPESHPFFVGIVGRSGTRTASEALKESDFVLAVGSRLSDYATMNWTLIDPAATIVQVDIDPSEIGRQYPVDIGAVADCRMFLRDLIPAVKPLLAKAGGAQASARARALGGRCAAERASVLDGLDLDSVPTKARRLVKEIGESIRRDAIIAIGGGRHSHFINQHVPVDAPRGAIRSVGFGAIGFAFPASLGAKLACPDRQVLCLVGDGDFCMSMQDMETAARERINVVTVVFNDSSYSSVKFLQARHFGRNIGVDYTNPDFAKYAELGGARGFRVERPGEIRPALEAALKENRPCVVDVILDSAEKTYYGVFAS
ncbi:MAG: thiamine pyrophosphate-binding protein [Betaproteobacteria bacterium]|nr:thiamine pyrophosphate-binding protein [Betaproteobacteria bacterium]